MNPDQIGVASDESISLLDLARRAQTWLRDVWAERATVLRFGIVGVGVGLFLALGTPREYTASMTVLPYRSPSSAGGLGGLAGLAGLRMPGATGAEQLITVDLYPEVSSTLDFRIALAESPIRFAALDTSLTLVQYFETAYRPGAVAGFKRYTIGLPGLLLEWLSVGSDGSDSLRGKGVDTAKIVSYSPAYLLQVNTLRQRLKVSSDRKTGVLRIVGQMPDEYAAADLVRTAAALLMERIIAYEARKATEQLRFLEGQLLRIEERYSLAERAHARFLDQNRVLVSATAQIERDRLERRRALAAKLLEQVNTQLEDARIKVSQDTPVFTVLDPVTVPSGPSAPRRGRVIVISTLLAAFAGIGWVLLRKALPRALRTT